MKSKFLTLAMTALSTLAPALTLAIPSLAHANEQFVCKLADNSAYGIAVTLVGPKTPNPTGVNDAIHYDPLHKFKSAVVVTFFGPNSTNSVNSVLTSQSLNTRVGLEVSYFIDLSQNEKIELHEQYWSATANPPYKKTFDGYYVTPGKTYPLACK